MDVYYETDLLVNMAETRDKEPMERMINETATGLKNQKNYDSRLLQTINPPSRHEDEHQTEANPTFDGMGAVHRPSPYGKTYSTNLPLEINVPHIFPPQAPTVAHALEQNGVVLGDGTMSTNLCSLPQSSPSSQFARTGSGTLKVEPCDPPSHSPQSIHVPPMTKTQHCAENTQENIANHNYKNRYQVHQTPPRTTYTPRPTTPTVQHSLQQQDDFQLHFRNDNQQDRSPKKSEVSQKRSKKQNLNKASGRSSTIGSSPSGRQLIVGDSKSKSTSDLPHPQYPEQSGEYKTLLSSSSSTSLNVEEKNGSWSIQSKAKGKQSAPSTHTANGSLNTQHVFHDHSNQTMAQVPSHTTAEMATHIIWRKKRSSLMLFILYVLLVVQFYQLVPEHWIFNRTISHIWGFGVALLVCRYCEVLFQWISEEAKVGN